MKSDIELWLMENSSKDNPKRLTEIYDGTGLGVDYSYPKVGAYLRLLTQEGRVQTIKIIVDPNDYQGNYNNYNVYWVE